MESTPLEKFCKVLKPRCGTQDYFSKYRSVDGSCNHMNESWGRAFTGYRRLVFPKYSDGVAEPRKSSDHKELPSARVVSVKLIKDMSKEDETLTLAVMQWGQFVTHDMAHTASSRMCKCWDRRGVSGCLFCFFFSVQERFCHVLRQ